uniref:Uncharacterized protein n=1 Tax=Plectus sambesii TaxID=2011161 RepID=A0A914WBD3_9BILA
MHAGGQTDAMFAAFSDGDITGNNTKPPVGSRLMQYMQGGGQQRAANGWNPSTSQGFTPNNMGVHAPPPTTRLTPTGQFAPPPPFGNFANMSLDGHHNQNAGVDKLPMPSNAGGPPSMFPPLQRPLSFPGMPPDQRQTPSPSSSAVNSTGRNMTRSPVVRGPTTPDNPSPFVQVQESVGGTTYFFPAPTAQDSVSQEQQQQQLAANSRPTVTTPGFFAYTGPLPHVGRFRPKGAGVASFFAPHELKMDLLNRQLAVHSQVDPATYPDLPQEIEGYHHLVPLEPPKPIGVVERNF